MPLSLAQAHVVIAAAHDHAVANGWKIAVAVVDEGGLLVALGRMDGAASTQQVRMAEVESTSESTRREALQALRFDGEAFRPSPCSSPGWRTR